MSEYDKGRRAFLVGAAGAGAAAGTALVPGALAKTREHSRTAEAGDTAHPAEAGEGHGAFFNDENAATIAAFCRAADARRARQAGRA